MTIPHEKNFCGGNFDDWLEVKLTNVCNGSCTWCVEHDGFVPAQDVAWFTLADSIIKTDAMNIMLLGGEPTLYRDLVPFVSGLLDQGRKILTTTNGSTLHVPKVLEALKKTHGVNISIHHYDMSRNGDITGVLLDDRLLHNAVRELTKAGVDVRLNCNLIEGQIDRFAEVQMFVRFARHLGASSVRFAELKGDGGGFVDARFVFRGRVEDSLLPLDPFTGGCWHEFELDGMHINLRLMCGLQTTARPAPKDPQQATKQVMYSDGEIREGWLKMTKTERDIQLLVRQGVLSQQAADQLLNSFEADLKVEGDKVRAATQVQAQVQGQFHAPTPSGGGCVY